MLTFKKARTDFGDEMVYQININGIECIAEYWDLPKTVSLYNEAVNVIFHQEKRTEKIIATVLKHSMLEIKEHFSQFFFYTNSEWFEQSLQIEVYCTGEERRDGFPIKNPAIRVNFRFDPENWSKAWSILIFSEELSKSIESYNSQNLSYFRYDNLIEGGVGLEYAISDVNHAIGSEVEIALSYCKEIVNITNRSLLAKIDQNSLITYFQFPPE